jgi:predicted dehydrogenase
MNRRQFLEAGVATGTGLLWLSSRKAFGEDKTQPLNVALIGAGIQGRALVNAAILIPNVRFCAVCDLWEPSRRTTKSLLQRYGHEVVVYADYQELLAKEKTLQAVLIATPNFVHAEQVNACLRAGLAVYCERPMAHSTAAAESMVRTMKETGKLLQIGYQRRSNPRYRHVRDNLLAQAKLPGRLTQVNTHWHQPMTEDLGWPRNAVIADEVLRGYGYSSMNEFRNWRQFKKLGGGPLADFGAHQLDVMQWLLDATPKSILAMGGRDFFQDRQWPDNVTALLEFATPAGTVRGVCQVLTTTSGTGASSYEHFLGTEGSIQISENAKWTRVYREAHAPDWEEWVRRKFLASEAASAARRPATSEEVNVRETGVAVPYEIPLVLDKPVLQPHLENFFDAIRGTAQLNCSAEVGFATETTLWRIAAAVDAQSPKADAG